MNIVLVKNIPDASLVKEVDLTNPLSAYKIFKEMEKVCIESKGIGLAAVQVGLPLKLFIVRLNNQFAYFANCAYEKSSEGNQTNIEGCLSLPNRFFTVKRNYSVKVTGKQLKRMESGSVTGVEFIDFSETFSGFIAAVFSHEIDHQFGILISNIGKEVILVKK